MAKTGRFFSTAEMTHLRTPFLTIGLFGLVVFLTGGCVSTDGGHNGETAETELVRLSDRTRVDFGLHPSRLDSIQFFLDRPVTYIGRQTETDSSSHLEDGVVVAVENQAVRVHRLHIKAGTPGLFAGSTASPGEQAGGWDHLDVDFGGIVIRFDAGRGGDLVGASASDHGVRTMEERPVLYYAPASTVRTDSLLYRLDRRSYTGATLSFLGTYQLTRSEDRRLFSPPGRLLSRQESDRSPGDFPYSTGNPPCSKTSCR